MDNAHCTGMPAPRARALTPVESDGLPLASTLAALPGRLRRQRELDYVTTDR